ncbi:TPA: hypothetical protein ACRM4R_006206, partial [Pseudomonas aeruginosa]
SIISFQSLSQISLTVEYPLAFRFLVAQMDPIGLRHRRNGARVPALAVPTTTRKRVFPMMDSCIPAPRSRLPSLLSCPLGEGRP